MTTAADVPETDFGKPVVFWHVAAMNHWRNVVTDQLALLASSGLRNVRVTFLGAQGELDELQAMADVAGITLLIEHTDTDIGHCEKFAMLAIERWAKTHDDPILYFHTKGVSAPWNMGKQLWREQMQREVIAKWRENLALLETLDLVGCNWNTGMAWMNMGPHMAGNFWLTRADYVRKLQDFTEYQTNRGGHRYACEDWIGFGNPRVKELASWEAPFN